MWNFPGNPDLARDRARSIHRSANPTPRVIALSATLNDGQYQSCQCHCRKSTTLPRRTRSIRLPECATDHQGESPGGQALGGPQHAQPDHHAQANGRPEYHENQRCQPPASLRKLNAAPVL